MIHRYEENRKEQSPKEGVEHALRRPRMGVCAEIKFTILPYFLELQDCGESTLKSLGLLHFAFFNALGPIFITIHVFCLPLTSFKSRKKAAHR